MIGLALASRWFRPGLLAVVLLGTLGGCARTVVIEINDEGGTRDAGAPDAGNGACAPGGTLLPVTAAVASTWAPNNVCGAEDALALDGVGAGLDLFGSAMDGCDDVVPDPAPCGCVAVDFGQTVTVDQVTIHMGFAADACGRACGAAQCNSGHTALVSYGIDEAGYWDNPQTFTVSSSTIQPYGVDVGGPLRWVVVCRIAFSADRDDFVVDAITATCM